MNRGIIYGKVNDFIIATTHLESEFCKDNPCKIKQLNLIIELLSRNPKVIIVGDTNLINDEESKIDFKDFKDVY